MSGASNGLLDAYYHQNSFNSSISTHGVMSFHPAMQEQSHTLFGSQSSFMTDNISEETAKKIASLQVKLNRKLGPEYISQRPGPGGVRNLRMSKAGKLSISPVRFSALMAGARMSLA